MARVIGGRYEVERELGRGAAGRVLLARDRAAKGDLRAVKLLQDRAFAARLRGEFALLTRLQHPGLVRVLDLGEDAAEGAFLVMEYVEGVPLAGDAARDPEAAAQALRALAFIHSRGVLHGDLKPANVLIAPDGRVKLLDFGLARSATARGASAEAPSGTLQYLAPELLRGAAPDARSDLYALGCVLYGRPPFRGTTREIIDGHLHGAPGPPEGPLAELVARLLEKDPAARPASAAAALARVGPAHARETPETARAYLRTPTALGREAEMERLAAAQGGAVVLDGPPSSGRTRLLQELARRVRLDGRRAALVECAEGSSPLGPLREACAQLGEPALLDFTDPTPRHRDGRAFGGPWPSLDAAAMADAAARALVRLGAGTLVALDDAARADELTLRTASALERLRATMETGTPAAAGGAGVPLLVLGGAPPGAEVTERVAIGALSRDAIAAWCGFAYPGREVLREFVDAIARWSGGAPALVEAALENLWQTGAAVPGACEQGTLPASPEIRATGAEEVIAARISALPDDVRDALAAAAIARRTALVESIAARPTLALLEEEGLWPPAGAVRRAALSLLAPARARELHRALADAAAAPGGAPGALSGGANDPERLADRAHHLLGCGDPRGREAALEAGRAFATRSRGREAARWLEAGLAAPDAREGGRAGSTAGARASTGSDAQLADTWLLLSRVRTATSDFDGALEAAASAARLGEPARAKVAAAETHLRRGDYREAAAALEAALAESPPAELRAEATAHLARTLSLAGDNRAALERAAEGLRAAAPDSAAAGDLESARALAAYYLGDLRTAAASFEAADRVFARLGDASRRAAAVTGTGLVHHREGRYADAVRAYEESLRLAEEAHDRSRVGTAHLNLGAVQQERGDHAAALRHYRDALSSARVLGDRTQASRASANLAALCRFLGQLDAGALAAAEARTLAEAAGARTVAAFALLVEGEIAAFRERWSEAREKLEAARAAFEAQGSVGEQVEAEVDLAEADLEQREGEKSLARALGAEARAHAAGLTVHRARALIAAGEAEAARAGGDPRRALEHLHAAMSLLAGARDRPDVLFRARAALARAYAAAGDRVEAAHHARRGLQILEEMAARLVGEERTAFLARSDRARKAEALAALAPPEAAGDPRIEKLLAVNRKLGAEPDLKALLTAIVDAAIELTGAERGFVLLPADKPGAPLHVTVARNIDRESLRQAKFKVSRSIAERVIASGEPEMTIDAQDDDRYREQLSIHAMKLRSVLCVPLRFQGEVLGALYVDNRFKADAFGTRDRALLEAFSDQAGIALSHARALEAAARGREDAEKARAEVEALAAQLKDRVAGAEAELERARLEMAGLSGRAHGRLVGQSPSMKRVFAVMDRIAPSDLPVLITGESGTGKELVARALYAEGPRREKPFVTVNCAAVPEGLLESELFGHVRGAFTGADRDRPGLFRAADGGTLFLDEVGDMGPAMQVKLLRALQDGEIRKVGGQDAERVNVRIVAATNHDPAELIREGKFREDLYYRLNVISILLPPLRERREDIPQLVDRFLADLPAHPSGAPWRVEPEALALLLGYPWPGNVRELQATVRNAAVFASGPVIGVRDLVQKPELVRGAMRATSDMAGRRIEDLEMEAIRRTLEMTGGNKRRAAQILGIDRKTLYNKLRQAKVRPLDD